MSINKFIQLCFISILCVSCIRGSSTSKEHHLVIDFSNNTEFKIEDITVVVGIVDVLEENLYQLTFDPLRGGFERVLGYTYKSSHGDDYKDRLTIKCGENGHEFSVNEILAWPTKEIKEGETIYIAPKLCD